jgi:hypothetical protein
MEGTVTDSTKRPLEVIIIHRGIQILTVVTFVTFFGWALRHLYEIFR